MEEMRRTFLTKLEGKRHDKTWPNYRFTVHLAGKFLFSFKHVRYQMIFSNMHFHINFRHTLFLWFQFI